MTTITLDLDIKKGKLLKDLDKEKLSFLVSRVFDEYIEELKDLELSKQIMWSKKLDNLLSNVKF